MVVPLPSDNPQVISDLDIRDEFASLAPEASLREIAKILAKNEVKVILIVDKTKREVVGVITEQRFLQACATGVDPESAIAQNYMSTNILRLLGDTPLQAARNLVDEKEPDAVIALGADRKFRGYLSPEDYRHLRSLTKAPAAIPSKPPIVISDLDIRDEFASIGPEASLRQIAKILAKNEVKVILIVDKTKREVVGIITEQRFLQACATGVDPESAIAQDYMSTNVLRLLGDTPLQAARNLVDEKEPDAVIVMAGDRKFRGYLSPEDYRHLRDLTKAGQSTPSLPVKSIQDEVKPLLNITGDVISVDSSMVTSHIRGILSGGQGDRVIWEEDGSELLIHCDSAIVTLKDGMATCSLDVECDQTGISEFVMTFCLGSKDILTNLSSTFEEAPRGPPLIVGRWGPVLQDVFWSGLLDIVAKQTANPDIGPKGIGADEGHLWIRTRPAEEMQIQLVQRAVTRPIGGVDSGGAVI